MVNQGLLDNQNLELIDGQIIDMPSQSSIHSICIRLLEQILGSVVQGKA